MKMKKKIVSKMVRNQFRKLKSQLVTELAWVKLHHHHHPLNIQYRDCESRRGVECTLMKSRDLVRLMDAQDVPILQRSSITTSAEQDSGDFWFRLPEMEIHGRKGKSGLRKPGNVELMRTL